MLVLALGAQLTVVLTNIQSQEGDWHYGYYLSLPVQSGMQKNDLMQINQKLVRSCEAQSFGSSS